MSAVLPNKAFPLTSARARLDALAGERRCSADGRRLEKERTMRQWTRILLAVVLACAVARPEFVRDVLAASRLKEHMTAAEFERAGLHKLTPAELAALESWLASRYSGNPRPSGSSLAGSAPSRATELVEFNTSNGKYHCASCQWALRCTRNCVKIPLSEARARGTPCKVCGGSCE